MSKFVLIKWFKGATNDPTVHYPDDFKTLIGQMMDVTTGDGVLIIKANVSYEELEVCTAYSNAYEEALKGEK